MSLASLRTFFTVLLAALVSVTLMAPQAEAKRLGGGKSSGLQRSAPPAATPKQVPAAPAHPQKRSWLGPLAGLAAGLGLAALFSHLGLGDEMASFLLIGLAVMAAVLVVRWLMRRSAQQPAAPVSAAATAYTPLSQAPSWSLAGMTGGTAAGPTAAPVATAATFPPGFDEAAFVRVAKVNFIRLQDANDRGDLEDLRAFTTPELFAEIRMQLSERGAAPNHTDVVELRAAVVDYAQESARDVASVRFSGLIREAKDAPAVAFDETWHLIQPRDGSSGWLVAGIQQNS